MGKELSLMARYFGIAGVQMEVVPEVDNSGAAVKLLKTVASYFPWVDLVLFSELCIHGLNPSLKELIPNQTIEKFCAWARKEKKWLIPGSFFEMAGKKTFNTAVVISPQGKIVAKYRKIFPWRPLERNDAGGSFCVFDIPGKGRFGLCICYDQWFPEIVRTLTWMGAEAILHPTATTTSDRPQELILSQAQAIFNQVYFLSVNGVGAGGVGKSIFVDPEGHVLQIAGERETILTEVIDLELVHRVREYGTLGLSQLWKDLRSFGKRFQPLPVKPNCASRYPKNSIKVLNKGTREFIFQKRTPVMGAED
jgi:predicted amidohydrolase